MWPAEAVQDIRQHLPTMGAEHFAEYMMNNELAGGIPKRPAAWRKRGVELLMKEGFEAHLKKNLA